MHGTDFVTTSGMKLSTGPVAIIDFHTRPHRVEVAELEIEAGRIVARKPAEGAPRFFVLPGFIDVHLHWLMQAGTSLDVLSAHIRENPDDLAERAIDNARRTIAAGVTSALDKGAPTEDTIRIYHAIERARDAGVPMPRAPFSPFMLVREKSFAGKWCARVVSEEQIDALVDAMADAGAGLVKIIPETDREEHEPHYRVSIDPALVNRAGVAARRRGLLFAVHAKGNRPIDVAIEAGANHIEHVLEVQVEQLRTMEERGIFSSLTLDGLACRLGYARAMGAKIEQARAEWVGALRVAALMQSLHPDRPFENLTFGSDAGSFKTPHASLEELYHLRCAGFDVAEVLRAATWNGARALRMENSLGALLPGYAADILFFEHNPLEMSMASFFALPTQIAAVMAAGKFIERDAGRVS